MGIPSQDVLSKVYGDDAPRAAERLSALAARYDEAFGAGAVLCPDAVVDTGKFELKTPDVTIRVNPERTDLIETRVLDGVKYILVRAGDGVEVNGIGVKIR